MLARYERCMKTLSEADLDALGSRTVAVVGCGGLGGYLIEYLARLGVGRIIAADGDLFEETNLNRQLLSETSTIRHSKAEAARRRVLAVNPLVRFTALSLRIDAANGEELLGDADLMIDAVDSIDARFVLQEIAEKLRVPLIHGAVGGWFAQVATIMPGDRTFDRIYGRGQKSGGNNRGIEAKLGNLSFGPALTAALQTAEAVKVLLEKGQRLNGRLLTADLLEYDFETLDLRRSDGPAKEGAQIERV